MTSHAVVSLVSVLVLVAVHLGAGLLDRIQGYPRRLVLSTAGGVTVSYVVMQLLPALSRSDDVIRPIADRYLPLFGKHGYFLAVLGMIVFYANANQIALSRQRRLASAGPDSADTRSFLTSMAVMLVFNVTVAYSLADPSDTQVQPIVLFVIAMGLYYLVADESLHANYRQAYQQYGRWVLSAALLAGWALGTWVRIPQVALALIVAFFAGGALVTVLARVLQPGPRRQVGAFALGAVVYALLLMALSSSA